MDKNKEAIKRMQEQDYEQAAKIFTEIIDEQPDDPLGYINFGNLLLHMDDLERAERFFVKAIELDKQIATAYYGLGNLYYEQENYQQAAENFERSIELGLEESDVYYMLGMTLLGLEQVTPAIPYLLRATELAPKDVEVHFQYGLALAQSNYLQEAKDVFHTVLKEDSNHSDSHYNLAVIALYNEDATAALAHFDIALEIQPDHLLAANGKKQVEQLLNKNKP